jgi:hypothetical protein
MHIEGRSVLFTALLFFFNKSIVETLISKPIRLNRLPSPGREFIFGRVRSKSFVTFRMEFQEFWDIEIAQGVASLITGYLIAILYRLQLDVQFCIISKDCPRAKDTVRFIPSYHQSLCIPRPQMPAFHDRDNAIDMPANSIATNHTLCTIPCHQTPRKLFIPTDARRISTNDNTSHERKVNTQNSDNFRYGFADRRVAFS